ncbi:MAG: glycosyltransferase [Clostridium sp.]|nr:glycosyltransferase [Clostridium sp.]
MNTIKVSVLIPIYGVEKYIARCARSLFNQTLKEGIEFIFVNDATKDNSMDVLKSVIDEFPNRKEQIRIIEHSENKGLAVARVTGVTSAKGEYVTHCDSDDWVEPTMYEKMYNVAKQKGSDIVVCDYVTEKQFVNGGGIKLGRKSCLPGKMLRHQC